MKVRSPEEGNRERSPASTDPEGVPRRRFLYQMLTGVAAAASLSPVALSARASRAAGPFLPADGASFPDESFWQQVKARFPLHPRRISMNAANLCPTPTGVTEVVSALAREIDGDQSFQNRARFGPMREEARAALARYLGADPEEVAMVRNTSEGNNIVIGGLDLGPGDEVVLWDQNHPSNNVAWDVRAERLGFAVRRVTTPQRPESPEDLLGPFLEATGPGTRVLAVTHVSNVTGVQLPIRALCAEARERGILTLVDGAQTFGSHVLDLPDLGCDFFTGSAHKWFMGPKEVGILYARPESAARVWPGVVSVGWPGARDRGALRFETLGQRDDPRVVAMETAVGFHQGIGPRRIEDRIRTLMRTLREGIREAVPDARFVTPEAERLSGGVLVFQLPGVDRNEGYRALYREHGIGGAAMGGESGGIRLCPHIYNTLEDAERAVAAVAEIAGRG
jgi:isopenicillin-N epimerase